MITLVWDVDDVLNDFMKVWFEEFWIKKHPECTLSYHDLKENPPHDILDISLDAYRESLDNFRLERGFLLQPIPEITAWFNQYGANYRHMALTAVPIEFSAISASWVFRHFGKWIRSFNIVPSPRRSDPAFNYDTTKGDFLKWIRRGDTLIEDNLQNISEAEKIGLKTIIIPRPWNKNDLSLQESLMLIPAI
jgi:hypothetical protein